MSRRPANDASFRQPGPDRTGLADESTGAQPHRVPVDELLTPRFLARHTRYADFAAFAAASGLSPIAQEDLESGRGTAWNAFVSGASDYPNWSAMLHGAQSDWVLKRLGIALDG